jgi:hypothetical protein
MMQVKPNNLSRLRLSYVPHKDLSRTIALKLEEVEAVKQIECELVTKERR